MRRKYFKLQTSKKETALAILQWIDCICGKTEISGKTFLDFSRKWVELRNRGGLVVISDNFFICAEWKDKDSKGQSKNRYKEGRNFVKH